MSRTHSRRHATRIALTLAAVLPLAGVACRFDKEVEPEPDVAAAPSPAAVTPGQVRASVPAEGYNRYDAAAIEAGRRDAAWRASAEWDRRQRTQGPWLTGSSPAGAPTAATGAPAAPAAEGAAPIERLRQAGTSGPGGAAAAGTPSPTARPAAGGQAGGESFETMTPAALQSFQPRFPVSEDGGPTVLAVQQLLDRVGFSPGVIDGRWGKNTEKALYWLQDSLGMEPTGTIDQALFDRLRQVAGTTSPVTTYRVTAEDVAGPFVQIPDEPTQQAELECLCYSSASEALAERFHTTRDLLAKLNPQANLDQLAAGAELLVPDVEPFQADQRGKTETAEGPKVPSNIAAVVVSKEGFYVQAVDAEGRVLYHFPTTVGAGYDASPSGDLKVTAIALRPTFHYQPTLFADVPDDEAEALLQPGPNSPVGVVWMQLSKENYGIHGTAEPASIGYSTSHGCVRLTNWDAQFLADRLPAGTPVMFRGEHPTDAARQASGAGAQPSATPSPAAGEGR